MGHHGSNHRPVWGNNPGSGNHHGQTWGNNSGSSNHHRRGCFRNFVLFFGIGIGITGALLYFL